MVKPKKREKKSKTRHHAVESDEGVGAGSGGGDSVSMNDDANVDNEVARRDKARRDKAIRSAKRHKKRMAELGLDLNGAPLDNYSLSKYPVRECKLSIRGFKEQVVLNPVVNGIGIVGLWGVVAWAQVNPIGATATLSLWSSQIVLNLSWLLQFSCAYTFFFILYILYKYGHVHLGRKSEKPEFSLLTATAMILASATGPSILIFGVAEPPPNRFGNFFAMAGYRSQDEVDLFAVNLAVFKWGMISWTHIALVAIGVSLASNHFGLPLTLRSCFLPTFKSYTWGWIGDVIDGCAIISTVTGACGTMTFTCFQVVVSLVYIKVVNDTEEDIGAAIALAILLVTVLSTASVISGLRGGVRFFSRLAFGLSTLLLCLVLFLDDTKFLLNLQVQEFGYFLQTSLFQLNFWTDAFGQLREGSGRAIDDGASDEKWYSKHVVLFYASISVSTSCGMLTAHVTRGRKLREVIALGLLFPIMYTLAWFCTWSGIGFRQDRQALELQMLGTEHFNNSAHFMTDGSSMCYDVPQESVIVDNTTIFTNFLPDVTPVCQLDYSAEGFHSNVLNILSSFRFAGSTDHGPGVALVLLFALTCAVNLIASADSTSLMVDSLASSARKNYHWLRRLFWAGTVGALAISLLSLGGDIFQSAIESFLVVSTFPMLIIMCFVLHPILLLCRAADEDPDGGRHESEYRVSTQAEFDMPIYGGIFNMVEYIVSMGKVNVARVELGMHQPTTFQITEFAKGLVLPFVSLHQVLSSTYPQSPKTNAILVAGYTFCFVAWFATWITSSQWYPGLGGLNWAFLVAMGVILGMVRSSFRAKYSLQSNVFADFVGSLFLWPQVLTQMRLHCEVQGGNAKRSCNVDSSEDRIEC